MTESTELTVIERAAIALGADEGEKQLIALAKKYTDITDIKNPAGRTQCHAAAMELSNARIHVDKTGKAAREDANAFQKAVIAEVARRVAIIKPEEDRLLALRDEWDEARAAEKAAIAAAEKARVDGIRARIEAFMLDAVTVSSGTAAEIDAHATSLSLTVIDLEGWQEFAGEAQVKRDDTVKWLRERQQDAANREAEALRLAEERAQLAKEREEAAERERQAAAERQRIADEERIARAKAQAAMLAEQQAHEARLRAEREAAEAELRKQREAEEARLAEQRAELARQQAAIDAANAEQERIAREAREATEAAAKLEADHAEALICNELHDAAVAKIAAEAREQAERQAAEAEAARRVRVQFEKNGPGDEAIVARLADIFDVKPLVVVGWLEKFNAAAFKAPEEKAA